MRCAYETIPHGHQCGCRLLAAAACARPEDIPFSYCLRVLKRRWRVHCDHGETFTPPTEPGVERWAGVVEGRPDTLRTILIHEF